MKALIEQEHMILYGYGHHHQVSSVCKCIITVKNTKIKLICSQFRRLCYLKSITALEIAVVEKLAPSFHVTVAKGSIPTEVHWTEWLGVYQNCGSYL